MRRTSADQPYANNTSSPLRPGTACVASWPGIYETARRRLVRHAHGQQTSAAMVFPPKVTQCSGEHSPIPKEEGLQGECWCWALYGERRPSGCKWFAIWIQNIHRAMECGANLHVYFREDFVVEERQQASRASAKKISAERKCE